MPRPLSRLYSTVSTSPWRTVTDSPTAAETSTSEPDAPRCCASSWTSWAAASLGSAFHLSKIVRAEGRGQQGAVRQPAEPEGWADVKPTLTPGAAVADKYDAKMAADGFAGCAR